jgi:cupin 2 domain-containing protein
MNLFTPLADGQRGEVVERILERPGLRILRIRSHGEASPPGFWYDEAEGEWVALLKGAARLRFEDEKEPRTLLPGDFVAIAPHRRHRVEWTDPQEPTIWLAVYYR